MFTYTVLVKMEMTPNWQEFYSIAYITALGCEKIREIISSEPVAITYASLSPFLVWLCRRPNRRLITQRNIYVLAIIFPSL